MQKTDDVGQAILENGVICTCAGIHFQDYQTNEQHRVSRGDIFKLPSRWTELTEEFISVRSRIGQGLETFGDAKDMKREQKRVVARAISELTTRYNSEIREFISEWIRFGKAVRRETLGEAIKETILRGSREQWRQVAIDAAWNGVARDYGWVEPKKPKASAAPKAEVPVDG